MESLDALAEKLLLLPSLAALQSQLNQKSLCLKLALLEDPGLQNLVKAAVKRFPDPDAVVKEKQLQTFVQGRSLHLEQLQPVFQIMSQVCEWTGHVLEAFKSSSRLVGVDFPVTTSLATVISELMVTLCHINFLFEECGDTRKVVVVLLPHISSGSDVRDRCKIISKRIQSYDGKLSLPEAHAQLFKLCEILDTFHSPGVSRASRINPESLKVIATQASVPKEMELLNFTGFAISSRNLSYLVTPYLLFPQEASKDVDDLTTVCEYTSFLKVSRNHLINIHEEITKLKIKTIPKITPIIDFEAFMEENHSLKDLVFFTDIVNEHALEALGNQSAMTPYNYIVGFAFALTSAPFCAAPAFPAEIDGILGAISSRAGDLVLELFHEVKRVSSLAANPPNTDKPAGGKKTKKKKNQANTSTSVVSTADQRSLWTLRFALHSLTVSMTPNETELRIHDILYRPANFLVQAIVARVTSFVNGSVYKTSSPVGLVSGDRKDAHLKDIDLMSLLIAAGVPIARVVGEVLRPPVGADHIKATGVLPIIDVDFLYNPSRTTKERTKRVFPKADPSQHFLLAYASWYLDALATKASTGAMVYSPGRQTVYSMTEMNTVRFEAYFNPTEYGALARLVGASGFRYLDDQLLKYVTILVGYVKEMAVQNVNSLQSLKENILDEAKTAEAINHIKYMPDFLDKATSLGLCLSVRNDISASAMVEFQGGRPEVPVRTERRSMLVDAFGVDVVDQKDIALQAAITVHANPTTDSTLPSWSLLPPLFAVALHRLAYLPDTAAAGAGWDNSVGVLAGNAGCLVKAFSVISGAVAACLGMGDEGVGAWEDEFWKISTTLLLRLHKLSLTCADKDRPPQLRAAWSALDEFGRMSKVVRADWLDEWAPVVALNVGMAGLGVGGGVAKVGAKAVLVG
ncbi:hypothetical protein M427DRAFT_72081 [Gonapodya prolifera JEL478]|uniref:Uncharacterized protein n=1 Tax=Gonapodya prolifera (strain JEL478) TaxID=1344416 RepID=A0A139A6Q5_GONPJ|nr:hypothetical protein M427DRAFT_72081 [Gonapodya prolifera JEL478]|eukprot:KXS12451.1 hypothetical protein M427DRAFT_72081 [Gonapodya prolifera JEL478]